MTVLAAIGGKTHLAPSRRMAGLSGFLVLSHAFERPNRYGASRRFTDDAFEPELAGVAEHNSSRMSAPTALSPAITGRRMAQ